VLFVRIATIVWNIVALKLALGYAVRNRRTRKITSREAFRHVKGALSLRNRYRRTLAWDMLQKWTVVACPGSRRTDHQGSDHPPPASA
jgi:hypothetical protein